MSTIPFMPTFVGDVLADIKSYGLTLEQAGAYSVLMWTTWKRRTPHPDDAAHIARVLGCTKGRWLKKLRPTLLQFFELDDEGDPIGGLLIQKRLEEELEKAKKSVKKSQKNDEKNDEIPPVPRASRATHTQTHPSRSKDHEGGATRLTPEFSIPDEWRKEAGEARSRHALPAIDLELEAAKFVAHYAADGRAKRSWQPLFVKWCLDSKAKGTAAEPPGEVVSNEERERRAAKARWYGPLKGWVENHVWASYDGPEPGQEGCQAPGWLIDEMQAKFARRRRA
jgi:uncharacterized protein YdaU (DUF1376 family)